MAKARKSQSAYEVMGLPRSCSKVEAKQAYNRLVKKVHPDKGGDETQFQQVQKVLTSTARVLYFFRVRHFSLTNLFSFRNPSTNGRPTK